MPINPTAIRFIRDEIAETERQLGIVELELRQLIGRRDALRLKKGALEGLVGSRIQFTDVGDGADEESDADEGRDDANDGEEGGSQAENGMSFRSEIRSVLDEAKKGLKPRDVAAALKARGVPYTGKVSFATRVSNELYRMRKIGHIRKRGDLYYAPMRAGSAGGEQG